MKRPRQRPSRVLTVAEREAVAARARYSGSAEHKVRRWWGGLPEARQLPGGRVGRRNKQTTTVCPLTAAQDRDRANTMDPQCHHGGAVPILRIGPGLPEEGVVRG